MLGSEWGSSPGGSELWLGSALGFGGWELLHAFCCLLCIFFLSVLLLLLFTFFAVLLTRPYLNPRVLSFSSHSPPHPSGGRGDRATTWPFVSDQSQTMTGSFISLNMLTHLLEWGPRPSFPVQLFSLLISATAAAITPPQKTAVSAFLLLSPVWAFWLTMQNTWGFCSVSKEH